MQDIQSPTVRNESQTYTILQIETSLARGYFPSHPIHTEGPYNQDERLTIPGVASHSRPPDGEPRHEGDDDSNPFLGVRRQRLPSGIVVKKCLSEPAIGQGPAKQFLVRQGEEVGGRYSP